MSKGTIAFVAISLTAAVVVLNLNEIAIMVQKTCPHAVSRAIDGYLDYLLNDLLGAGR